MSFWRRNDMHHHTKRRCMHAAGFSTWLCICVCACVQRINDSLQNCLRGPRNLPWHRLMNRWAPQWTSPYGHCVVIRATDMIVRTQPLSRWNCTNAFKTSWSQWFAIQCYNCSVIVELGFTLCAVCVHVFCSLKVIHGLCVRRAEIR